MCRWQTLMQGAMYLQRPGRLVRVMRSFEALDVRRVMVLSFFFLIFAVENLGYAFCGLQICDDWGYCGLVPGWIGLSLFVVVGSFGGISDFSWLIVSALNGYYEIPITDWAFLRAILHAYNALRGSGNVFGRLELLALGMRFAREILFSASAVIFGRLLVHVCYCYLRVTWIVDITTSDTFKW